MRYGKLKLEEIVSLVGLLGGDNVVRMMLARSSAKQGRRPKNGELTLGQIEALVNKLGGMEVVEAILSGEKTINLKPVTRSRFDRHARRIPPRGLRANVVDPDYDYYFEQPNGFDYAALIEQAKRFLSRELKLPSPAQFLESCEALEARYRNDEEIGNLFEAKDPCRGVRLPVVIPQMDIPPQSNVGKVMQEVIVPAIERAYETAFPGRIFCHYLRDRLDGEVEIVDESRHGELLDAMRDGPVVGWYFPTALQGFSVEADWQQMSTLPNGVVLSGFDAMFGMIEHASILARNGKTPNLDLAAFRWKHSASLCLLTNDGYVNFNYRDFRANSGYSGGLFLFR